MTNENQIEERLIRIEDKLDTHLEMATRNESSIGWLKLFLTGTWAAIGGLFYSK